MKIIEKMGLALLVMGVLGFIAPGLEAAQQTEIKVNCDKGESVQAALDKLTEPATIVVTGTCHEYVTIKKDDVSILGGNYLPPNPGGTILVVYSARRVSITGVTVTGGRNGITAAQGGSLTLGNSTISGTSNHGVVSNSGSYLVVYNSTIQDNSQKGVFVGDNSALVLTGYTITGNQTGGVLAQRASSARIGVDNNGVPGPNGIMNNGGSGVSVSRSAHAVIDGNTITDNSGHGINIEGASATVTNNTISNNNKKGVIVHNSGSARDQPPIIVPPSELDLLNYGPA